MALAAVFMVSRERPRTAVPLRDERGDVRAGASSRPSGDDPNAHPASLSAAETEADDQAQVRARLDEWLAAQNRGDYEAYAAFYVPGARASRRTDDRILSFERQPWLDDRRLLFGKGVKAGIESISMRFVPDGVVVSFVEKVADGAQQGEAHRELKWTRENGQWRIAREEEGPVAGEGENCCGD